MKTCYEKCKELSETHDEDYHQCYYYGQAAGNCFNGKEDCTFMIALNMKHAVRRIEIK